MEWGMRIRLIQAISYVTKPMPFTATLVDLRVQGKIKSMGYLFLCPKLQSVKPSKHNHSTNDVSGIVAKILITSAKGILVSFVSARTPRCYKVRMLENICETAVYACSHAALSAHGSEV